MPTASNSLQWRNYEKHAGPNIKLRQRLGGFDLDQNAGTLRLKRHDGENIKCIKFYQADATNNPNAVEIENDGAGYGLRINQDGDQSALAIDQDGGAVGLQVDQATSNWAITAAGGSIVFNHHNTETLTGDKTLAATDGQIQMLDPGGSGRTVTLPAEADSPGVVFIISNTADAAEVLTVQDDGSNTIVTPTQNESAIVWCDGTSWSGLVGDTS